MYTRKSDLFPDKFLFSSVRGVDGIYKEISSEYGFAALSRFIVSLNNKNAANQVSEVVDVIKSSFGGERVLVLWENERSL
jgi:hypothetical protein